MTIKIIVLDTETTGMEDHDRLVEFGACLMNVNGTHDEPAEWGDNRHHGSFSQLIDPCIPIPPEASAVHHITTEMILDKPSSLDQTNFQKFCDDSDFSEIDYKVAHNSRFDEKYLPSDFLPNAVWIDTYRVALSLYPDAPSHKNSVLFYYLGLHKLAPDRWQHFFETNMMHRALPDAIVTMNVLGQMMQEMPLAQMAEISRHPALLPKVTFGKHYGKRWTELPSGYLKWVLDQDFDEDVRHTAAQALMNA